MSFSDRRLVGRAGRALWLARMRFVAIKWFPQPAQVIIITTADRQRH